MKAAVRLSVACVFVLGACSKPDDPRVELTELGFALHLPAAMQHALDSAAPGFRTIRTTAYRSDVSQAAAASAGGIPALIATVGDFNHDGKKDVVMEGKTPGDSALQIIAILSGATPEAVPVVRFPVYDADAVGVYLSPAPAGDSAAFEVVAYPDSSILYRYVNGVFAGVKVGN
jgi:hypothetical protein